MTVESMLRLIAGLFVSASVLLGMFVHPYFLWFTLFVGLNLAQSAFSGWCPIVPVLRRAGARPRVTPRPPPGLVPCKGVPGRGGVYRTAAGAKAADPVTN
jgi:hypothetical protein